MERLRQFGDRIKRCECRPPSCTCSCSRKGCLSFLKHNVFVLVLIGFVMLGILLGCLLRLRPTKWTAREVSYLNFPGEIYLRMLKMLMVPLVATSIISAISSLDAKVSGKIGLRSVCYYLLTTIISVILGIILVLIIRPGGHNAKFSFLPSDSDKESAGGENAFLDLLRNFVPDNIIGACFEKTVTKLMKPDFNVSDSNETDVSPIPKSKWPLKTTSASGANILGILSFSVAFGIAMSRLREQTRVVQEFFNGLNAVIERMVRWVIWFTPIGICFLIAAKIAGADDPARTFSQLGLYTATVVIGLLIHFFLILPVIFFAFVRKNPFRYMFGMMDALLCAVSTASSAATLPLTIRCAVDANQVDNDIARVVLPVGAVVNMDGTALYEAVASIFIAQVNMKSMDLGTVVIVSLTATLAAIGAAGIPEGGLVTMLIILEAVGLPANDISLILAIDWFLDRLRTTTNVWGDAVGAAVVEKLSLNDINRRRYMTRPQHNQAFQLEVQPPGVSDGIDEQDRVTVSGRSKASSSLDSLDLKKQQAARGKNEIDDDESHYSV